MSPHHHNIKYLCNATAAWERQYLHKLGVIKLCCNFIDLKHNTYLPLGSGYLQYCEFMEKKLHLELASRISSGIRHHNPRETLYNVLKAHYFADATTEQSAPYAFDWTFKTQHGFELFGVISQQPLTIPHINTVRHWLRVFSHEGARIQLHKPKALLELENRDMLAAKFAQFEVIPSHKRQQLYV